MTKSTTIQFATAPQAWARVNQLESQLGLPLSAEETFIEKAWDRIEELEAQVAGKSTTAAPPKAAAAPSSKPLVDPLKHADPQVVAQLSRKMSGIERAAAAQREGRTAKRVPAADFQMPATGWGKAARAQAKLDAARKPKA